MSSKTVSSLKYIFWISRPFTHGTLFFHLQLLVLKYLCRVFFISPNYRCGVLHLLVCAFFIFLSTFSLSTLNEVSGLMILDFLPEEIALLWTPHQCNQLTPGHIHLCISTYKCIKLSSSYLLSALLPPQKSVPPILFLLKRQLQPPFSSGYSKSNLCSLSTSTSYIISSPISFNFKVNLESNLASPLLLTSTVSTLLQVIIFSLPMTEIAP